MGIGMKKEMKVMCMYLPQFHTTPDNDKWWGKGYTDWVAARNAKPYYKKHMQPRVPLDGNYYDLADESAAVWKWQAELAEKYGIYGFCVYQYWFTGRKVLEKPLEILLRHKEIPLRYSICWANEAWERNWYGNAKEVLIPQEYGGKTEWKAHFDYLLQFFQDERYIRIGNKPVMHIYKAHKIDCLEEMKAYWDSLARENGFDGIYLIVGNTAGSIDEQSKAIDAYYNFEPNHVWGQKRNKVFVKLLWWKKGLLNRLGKMTGKEYFTGRRSLKRVYRLILSERYHTKKRVYLGICPEYDDTPRRQMQGVVYDDASPRRFGTVFYKLIKKSVRMGSDAIYINAWNEWGETAVLEPDEYRGYAYLEQIRKALDRYRAEETE